MNAAALPAAHALSAVDWQRVLSYGVLWGIGVVALEAFDSPLSDLSGTQLLVIELRMVPVWCLPGIALAGTSMALDHRLTIPRIAPILVGIAMLQCALSWLFWQGLSLPGATSLPAWAADPQHLHAAWNSFIYGGLFVAAYRLSIASERTRRLLAQAEIARQQTEVLLGAERVRALQGQIDTGLLLRGMVEVERRYVHDAAGTQRLLDPLVNFLRAAMPGVRSGASTLAAEVLLARRYAELRAELDPGRTTWSIRLEGAMPEVPFPPLLLLPVLDQLTADSHAPGAELRVSQAGAKCRLSLSRGSLSRAPWLTPDLLYRLQVGLRTVFGEAWTLAVGEYPATAAFELTLPVERTEAPPAGDATVSPTPLEAIHG
jgi:hypothetical protein